MRWVPVGVMMQRVTQRKVKVGSVPEQKVNIWRLPGKKGLFFRAAFTVDADGAPNAYNPWDTGIDALSNAGRPGKWWALVTDGAGRPVVQNARQPFPGYYISKTSLEDFSKNERDTTRYVDSRNVPYIALPLVRYKQWGVQLGDFAVAVNTKNGKMSYAVFADEGPTKMIGEGSIALAKALGLNPDPRKGGTELKEIFYVVFPGSGRGQGKHPTVQEIKQKGAALFQAWGGMAQVNEVKDARDETENLAFPDYLE